MIEEIRVKARAASMEAAQREIEIVLGIAQQGAYLEGLGNAHVITDNHFGQVYGPDPWHRVGMGFEGRVVLRYEPTPDPGGGMKEYGFEVFAVEDYRPHGLAGYPRSLDEPIRRDVTDEVMVLSRRRPVTQESSHIAADSDSSPDATAEEILDNIRRLVNVEDVEISYDRMQRDRSGWRVNVTFRPDPPDAVPMTASAAGETLREAALAAYGMCGQEVTHYDTGH